MAKGAYIGAFKPEYEPIFKNNSWTQIIKACQKNEVPSTWTIGSQKDMTINGKDYTIDIIGKNHDDYADGSGKAPLTFQLHDCYDTSYRMNSTKSNANGWGYSEMRTTHLPAILALMPSEVQAAIKEVNKLTRASYSNSSINTTADKLFLLSMMEIFDATASNSSGEGALGEGSQYAYYKEGNSKIKKMNDTAQMWWARSPRITTSTGYCSVSTAGGASFYNNSHYAQGVSFAFCFGGTSQVNNTFGGNNIARKIKKGYVGISEMVNLCPVPNQWSLSGVTVADEVFTFPSGITAMSTCSMPVPTAGHKYYGRVMYKSPAGYTCGDGRFEYFYTDGQNIVFTTAAGVSTNDTWVLKSSIQSFSSVTATSFNMRNFTVNGTADCYRKEPMVIDLTEAFGAGNEPTVEWCDANIPYFVGNKVVPINGLSGVARKIKKAYIGIGGVARPFWGGGELAYYGTTNTPLSVARGSLGAVTVGNYALFVGGSTSVDNTFDTVDAYDKSLTRSTPTPLNQRRQLPATASVGDYAIVFTGAHQGLPKNNVDAYNSSLTRVTPTSLPFGRYAAAGTTLGNRALFGGGNSNSDQKIVDVYDSSLTLSSAPNFTWGRSFLAATTIGSYALFAGGRDIDDENAYTDVDVYDSTLTHTKMTNGLVTKVSNLAAANTSKHALFAGGNNWSYGSNYGSVADVTAYDDQLTRTVPTSLSVAMTELSGTSLGGKAIFGGGNNVAVNAYDDSLTLNSDFTISKSGYSMAATTVGDYALFGGGLRASYSDIVDVFALV